MQLTSLPYRGTLRTLQALRALAVSLVIIAHSIDVSFDFGISHISRIRHFENFGAVGVDIFFVISGVIMTIITDQNQLSAKTFLAKRFTRIAPLYWIATAIYCINPLGDCQPKVIIGLVVNTITIFPILGGKYFLQPLLFVGWTLAFEFLFYAIYAIGIWVNKLSPFYIGALILVLLVVMGICLPSIENVRFKFVTNPIIAEFLLGCIAAKIYLLTIERRKLQMMLGFVFLSLSALLFFKSLWYGFGNISEFTSTIDSTLSLQRVFDWGRGSFCLVFGSIMLENTIRKYIPAWLVRIGDSSFAAYLFHIPCLCILSYIWRRVHFNNPDFYIITAIVFCLLVSYFIYLWLEKPLQSYLARKLFSKR